MKNFRPGVPEHSLQQNLRLIEAGRIVHQQLHFLCGQYETKTYLARHRDSFSAALQHIRTRDLTNTVVEVECPGGRIACSEYALLDPG